MKAVSILDRASDRLQFALLSKTAKTVRREHLTYLSISKLRHLEKTLQDIHHRRITGDYLEFGIALGGSAILIAKAAKNAGRAFTGFDIFGTIPPPTSDKDDLKSKERYKTIAGGKSQGLGGDPYYGYRKDLYSDVVNTFSRFGLPVDEWSIALRKGLFQDTWPQWQPRAIAFVHIDCDWYDPVRYCLESVHNLIVPGGVILLDDYHDYGGAQTATVEFLEGHHSFNFEDGANVVLRRKDAN